MFLYNQLDYAAMKVMALVGLLVLVVFISSAESKFDIYDKYGLTWGCFHLAIPDNPKFYMNVFSGHKMPCAKGTVFSQKACVCVHAKRHYKGCEAAYSLTFSENDLLYSRPLSYKPYNIKYKNGLGIFNKRSQLKMWRYKNAPYGNEIQLQIRFKDESDENIEVLITNCGTREEPGVPSLLVFLDKTWKLLKKDLVRVLFRTTKNKRGAHVVVPYKKDRFNTLVILYAKDSLNVRIDYEQLSKRKPGGMMIQSRELKGNVLPTNHFLRIGTCPKTYGTSEENGFEGLVDWFDFYPCRP